MKRPKNTLATRQSTVKTSLNLAHVEGNIFKDEHGRLLEEYVNKEGKTDLRPVGLYKPPLPEGRHE